MVNITSSPIVTLEFIGWASCIAHALALSIKCRNHTHIFTRCEQIQ